MGNRTPDIQLAKLTLYQLSYTPACEVHDLRALKNLRKEGDTSADYSLNHNQKDFRQFLLMLTHQRPFLKERR